MLSGGGVGGGCVVPGSLSGLQCGLEEGSPRDSGWQPLKKDV